MLNNQELEKLMHDLKRASKALGLMKTEENKDKREIILGLLEDELKRLYEDLNEMKENGGKQCHL